MAQNNDANNNTKKTTIILCSAYALLLALTLINLGLLPYYMSALISANQGATIKSNEEIVTSLSQLASDQNKAASVAFYQYQTFSYIIEGFEKTQKIQAEDSKKTIGQLASDQKKAADVAVNQYQTCSNMMKGIEKKQESHSEDLKKTFEQIRNFFCAAPKTLLNQTILPISGKRIYFPHQSITADWYGATEYCDNLGMHLVTLKSEEELSEYHNETVKIFGNLYYAPKLWLSAFYSGNASANFEWHDGTQLPVNSTMWLHGERGVINEPDYREGYKSCVYPDPKHMGKLRVESCTSKYKFTCEL